MKSDSRQFLHKYTLTFLRHLLDLQKTSKLHAKLLSLPLKYDSFYVNIFNKIQVRIYQKSIRASLEKTKGAQRRFFLGYKDAHQKLRCTQGFFTPDTKLYSSLRNVFSHYGSNWHQTKSFGRITNCNWKLHYLKKTVHDLFTITANIEGGVLSEKSSETFKQNPWKITQKMLLFSKVARSKNEFIHMCFSRFLL